MRLRNRVLLGCGLVIAAATILWLGGFIGRSRAAGPDLSQFIFYNAPAGTLAATQDYSIDGYHGAILNSGRFITPPGVEVNVGAPKPFGIALSPDGNTLATVNSGTGPFSVTLITGIKTSEPTAKLITVNATFMGIVFSPDSTRFYASGGENGNVWVGDTASGQIVGSVNVNGSSHPLPVPLNVTQNPPNRFLGSFLGNMALTGDGRFLYVVDQGAFQVHQIDTSKIVTGVDSNGQVTEPNNFAAVVNHADAGRYPFGIARTPDNQTLFVGNVGIFQYTHLTPASPTGDPNKDYPLGYPGAGYPQETASDRTIQIKKVDPRNLPATLSIPDGIRVGYVPADQSFTVPGLGDPNAQPSSSVYVLNIAARPNPPAFVKAVKTGPLIGEMDQGIEAYAGSHPNSIAAGANAIYVANGNDDTISILDRSTFQEKSRVSLSPLRGMDTRLKGIQPVALALSPDGRTLFVAEAGINAVAMLALNGTSATVMGHIPAGWWPSAVQVSPDGSTLYVANASGRGAPPNNNTPPYNLGSPKSSTMGTVNIIAVPGVSQLRAYTTRVLQNNGFLPDPNAAAPASNPVPGAVGVASGAIKHIIFINKENSTYDQLVGDLTVSRQGVPIEGEPSYSLGYAASPNHHELALQFTVGDNFYLEPAVSSDGHRWLTNSFTTEFEETHWPASYGGQRNDAGDNASIYTSYPGRLGFTDANSSPEPNDYDEHGGIYMHLSRNGKTFVNFGNGFEFAEVDESNATEPTGIRNHVNVPMEKVLRDNSDQMFPEFNTHIPDGPLPEDPSRFNRFGRFQQMFEALYVDRNAGVCKLPSYVDLYYPNDHGGGANDINPNGPPWSYTRFVQDNDSALGHTVDLISHSPCWKDTVIFVVEDDVQNGLDHVNGYRSLFLAISPWVKREYVTKTHLSLASIFKTVDLILGIPPLNQYDAAATDLRDMFTTKADFTPYSFVNITYAKGANKTWLELAKRVDFSRPDADEVNLRMAILKSEGLPRAVPLKNNAK